MIEIGKWKQLGSFISKNWLSFLLGVVAGGALLIGLYEKFLMPGLQAEISRLEAQTDTLESSQLASPLRDMLDGTTWDCSSQLNCDPKPGATKEPATIALKLHFKNQQGAVFTGIVDAEAREIWIDTGVPYKGELSDDLQKIVWRNGEAIWTRTR